MLTLLTFALLAAPGPADAGAPRDGGLPADTGLPWDGGYDPAVPASWTMAVKLGAGQPAREALLAELTADAGADAGIGEAPLTRAEAEALLDDPRAQLVYGDKTVAIVAPSMVSKHRQEHVDLMKRFLLPERVEAGRAFAKQHEAVLAAVEQRTGVSREVIIGILMWESKLGTITGDWVAFNVLASQAFFTDEANAVALARKDEKQKLDAAAQARRVEKIRSRARKNLLALARQCKAKGIDVFTMKGSWAGALGFPQFMPASLRWADDGDGDGVIDLFHMPDAIASIGRYLAAHGFAKSAKDAVWGYNHEDAYVAGVLAFADALKKPAPAGGTVVPSAP
jgi:membrane-bound lytic murein transglycosylase B